MASYSRFAAIAKRSYFDPEEDEEEGGAPTQSSTKPARGPTNIDDEISSLLFQEVHVKRNNASNPVSPTNEAGDGGHEGRRRASKSKGQPHHSNDPDPLLPTSPLAAEIREVAIHAARPTNAAKGTTRRTSAAPAPSESPKPSSPPSIPTIPADAPALFNKEDFQEPALRPRPGTRSGASKRVSQYRQDKHATAAVTPNTNAPPLNALPEVKPQAPMTPAAPPEDTTAPTRKPPRKERLGAPTSAPPEAKTPLGTPQPRATSPPIPQGSNPAEASKETLPVPQAPCYLPTRDANGPSSNKQNPPQETGGGDLAFPDNLFRMPSTSTMATHSPRRSPFRQKTIQALSRDSSLSEGVSTDAASGAALAPGGPHASFVPSPTRGSIGEVAKQATPKEASPKRCSGPSLTEEAKRGKEGQSDDGATGEPCDHAENVDDEPIPEAAEGYEVLGAKSPMTSMHRSLFDLLKNPESQNLVMVALSNSLMLVEEGQRSPVQTPPHEASKVEPSCTPPDDTASAEPTTSTSPANPSPSQKTPRPSAPSPKPSPKPPKAEQTSPTNKESPSSQPPNPTGTAPVTPPRSQASLALQAIPPSHEETRRPPPTQEPPGQQEAEATPRRQQPPPSQDKAEVKAVVQQLHQGAPGQKEAEPTPRPQQLPTHQHKAEMNAAAQQAYQEVPAQKEVEATPRPQQPPASQDRAEVEAAAQQPPPRQDGMEAGQQVQQPPPPQHETEVTPAEQEPPPSQRTPASVTPRTPSPASPVNIPVVQEGPKHLLSPSQANRFPQGICEECRTQTTGLPLPHFASAMGHVACLLATHLHDNFALLSFDAASRSPLFYACANNQPDCCEFLIDQFPPMVNLADVNGDTPLHAACGGGSEACTRLLLIKGKAHHSPANKLGMTPAHLAKNGRVLHELFQVGADLSINDKQARTPLYLACATNRVDCALYLCEVLALEGVSCPDRRGDTPLHAAAFHGNKDCLLLLLQYGAPPTMPNNKGLTPIHLARKKNHVECLKLLQEYRLHHSVNFDTVLFLASVEGLRVSKENLPELKTSSSIHFKHFGEWILYKYDDGRTFWYNCETGVSQWEKPEELEAAPSPRRLKEAMKSMKLKEAGDWLKYSSHSTKSFYYNQQNGDFSFDKPPEFEESQDIDQTSTDTGGYEAAASPVEQPWQIYKDANGNVFYYNVVTQQSQWEVPPELEGYVSTEAGTEWAGETEQDVQAVVELSDLGV